MVRVFKCVPEGEYGVSHGVRACEELVHGPTQTGDTSGEQNRLQRVNLATAPGSRDCTCEVHGAFRTRPACVRVFAIRPGNVPRRTRAGRVDGENIGECCGNLERTGPHVNACAKLHVLHAACSVRGTCGVGFRDDSLGLVCTGNRAGSVCE